MASLDPIVDKLFDEAAKREASDIHLEPEPEGLRVRWRVKGQLVKGPIIEGVLKDSLVAKLKLLAKLDSTVTAAPQDGALRWNGVECRLSVIPVLGGQSVVLRIFGAVGTLEKLEGLGMEADTLMCFSAALKRTQGLIIIAGPTGSGKTTSFYAALRAINPQAHKIITVEDPVEQQLSGVCQVPVKGPLSFESALKSILRQSPNVIGVGELRDGASAAMALQAALTGHLVVATLHAESAAAVPVRLIDMGLEPFMVADVLRGVLAQRLINSRGAAARRRGLFEFMEPSAALVQAIRERASTGQIEEVLQAQGFTPMRAQAQKLMQRGELAAEAIAGELMEA